VLRNRPLAAEQTGQTGLQIRHTGHFVEKCEQPTQWNRTGGDITRLTTGAGRYGNLTGRTPHVSGIQQWLWRAPRPRLVRATL